MDVSQIALSGLSGAFTRLRNSAHNIANLTTDKFRNLRTRQVSKQGGGSQALTLRDPTPAPVDLAREIVEQIRAKHQATANLRVLGVDSDLRGQIINLKG